MCARANPKLCGDGIVAASEECDDKNMVNEDKGTIQAVTSEGARAAIAARIDHYNNHRLHSAIGYVAPRDKLLGLDTEIWAERDRKLEEAREVRRKRRELDHASVAASLPANPSLHPQPLRSSTQMGLRAGAAGGTVAGMGDKTAVAHHEAGHAIVAHVLGLSVGSTALEGEGDDWGGTTLVKPETTERRIVGLFAGFEAHLRHSPHDEAEAKAGAKDDYELIDSMAVSIDPLKTEELKTKLRGEARAHVEKQWEAISALATELIQHGRLSLASQPRLDTLFSRFVKR